MSTARKCGAVDTATGRRQDGKRGLRAIRIHKVRASAHVFGVRALRDKVNLQLTASRGDAVCLLVVSRVQEAVLPTARVSTQSSGEVSNVQEK